MNRYPRYSFTNDPLKPATIFLGDHQTPVWIQQRWEEGEYAGFIQKNGCGHCCVAMAARLQGVDLTPMRNFLFAARCGASRI